MTVATTVDIVLNRARSQTLACQELGNSLSILPTAAERKTAIMDAYFAGHIDGDQTELLIQAYQLETA